MFLKSLVFLALAQLSFASIECDGSEINVDGFQQSPLKGKAGLGEFPWTVALYKKDSAKPHCAGAIIDETTIVTTAFCVSR